MTNPTDNAPDRPPLRVLEDVPAETAEQASMRLASNGKTETTAAFMQADWDARKRDPLTGVGFVMAKMKDPSGQTKRTVVLVSFMRESGRSAKCVLPVKWLKQKHYPLLLALEGAVNRALKDVAEVPTVKSQDATIRLQCDKCQTYFDRFGTKTCCPSCGNADLDTFTQWMNYHPVSAVSQSPVDDLVNP